MKRGTPRLLQVDHTSRTGSLLVGGGALIARGIVRFLGGTRRSVPGGLEAIRTAVGRGPVILAFWHEATILAMTELRALARAGNDLSVIASRSRDGELVARTLAPWGLRVERGSSSRGGRGALLRLYRNVTRYGSSPVVIPDGPRGPARECKPGAIVLARTCGIPIVPLGFAASHSTRLKSWDRLIVPHPFARVGTFVGTPWLPPADTESDADSLELATRLDRAAAGAADLL